MAVVGTYTVLTYIDASGPTQGVSSDFSFYLVAIANASSGFGRLMAGFVADRIGRFTPSEHPKNSVLM